MLSGWMWDLLFGYGGKDGIVWNGGRFSVFLVAHLTYLRPFWLEIKWSIVGSLLGCWFFKDRPIRLNSLLQLIDKRTIVILH